MSSELATLATEIDHEIELGDHHGLQALEHYRNAGERLLEAKASVPHGDWSEWIASNVKRASERSAQRYMRLAKHWHEIEAKAPSMADMSLAAAEAILAKPKPALEASSETHDEFLDVLRSLAEIRDQRLYRETHATFEEYVRHRWGDEALRIFESMSKAELEDDSTPTLDELAAKANAAHRKATEALREAGTEATVDDLMEAVLAKLDNGVADTGKRVRTVIDFDYLRERREHFGFPSWRGQGPDFHRGTDPLIVGYDLGDLIDAGEVNPLDLQLDLVVLGEVDVINDAPTVEVIYAGLLAGYRKWKSAQVGV